MVINLKYIGRSPDTLYYLFHLAIRNLGDVVSILCRSDVHDSRYSK